MLGDLAAALRAIVSQRLLRTTVGSRMPAAEVLLNTKLIAELIEKGDFSGVREAMEKSMAEGSQTFEHDIARLIVEGSVDRKEGLAHADSPTNLLWRLQNDFTKAAKPAAVADEEEEASFTEITLDRRQRIGQRGGSMTKTLQLTEQLLSMASVTPSDGGCQALIAQRLAPLGFV
eukprot:gene37454-60755_t